MSAEKVLISNASRKHIVYHSQWCSFARRIKPDNQTLITLDAAMNSYGCLPCKFCRGLRVDVVLHEKAISHWSEAYQMQFTYDISSNSLYIRTDIGFWKIKSLRNESYRLFHLNHFSKSAPVSVMMKWKFHYQQDAGEKKSLDQLVMYIHKHDIAMKTIADDYRKLPQDTKKQKKYYAQAKNRERRRSWRRMDSLFDQVERELGKNCSHSSGVPIGQPV